MVISRGFDVKTVAIEAFFSNLFEVLTKWPNDNRVLPSKFHLNPVVLTSEQVVPRGIKPQWRFSRQVFSSLKGFCV